MKELKKFPKVLMNRLIFTILIGVGCLLLGIGYYFYAYDRVFLILSCVVFGFCILRSIGLYKTMIQQNYEVVTGVCVSISQGLIQKYRKVRLLNEDGVTSTLKLSKNNKLFIGHQYRFYFKASTGPAIVDSEYLQTALSTDLFLGMEDLGEYEVEGANVK